MLSRSITASAAAALLLTCAGCSTYGDVYSFKKNSFKAPPTKATELPPVNTTNAPTNPLPPVTPTDGIPGATPTNPGVPAIPGAAATPAPAPAPAPTPAPGPAPLP